MSSADEIITSYGDLATRWTVRLALLGYFVGAALRNRHSLPAQQQFARIAWTFGCLLYLAHITCAFYFFHHWSHAAAYQHTAERTAAVTGWNWGGGIYFNYAFSAVWVADVVALWLPPTCGPVARWLGQSLSDAPAPTTGAPPGRSANRPAQAANGQALPQPPQAQTPRTGWLEPAIQAFLWFMVFNATVVFGHGPVRWFGLAGCGWLLVLAVQRFACRRAVR